jgi:ankyrin repeat protein
MKSTGKLIIFVFTFLALAASAYAAEDSPLFEAVRWGDKATIEALLVKGADVNAKGWHGRTPLHFAVDEFKNKRDVAELLLAKGADVNAKDNEGETPLHLAVNGFERKRDVAELLLAKGADVNAKNMHGSTPLHKAGFYGNKGIAELLLAKGADVNAKDKRGETPYSMGGNEGIEDIRKLIEAHIAKQARLLEERIKSNPRAALVQLTAQLKGNPADDNTRRLIIKLASELKPAPAIPEEARKHFVEGTAIVKAAKNPAQQALAAQSFNEALKIAPWWGDAYYNLGVAQELAEKYDEAEKAFNFYLLTNPSATEKREVQDRIYGLSAKRKLSGAR